MYQQEAENRGAFLTPPFLGIRIFSASFGRHKSSISNDRASQ